MRSSRYPDPYFSTLDRPVRVRGCDCPGCSQAGDYRAPRSRDRLTDYYWFCLEHVREYNVHWDYFDGMSEADIENYTRSTAVWERPSWPLGEWQRREKILRDNVEREFFGEGGEETEARAAASVLSLSEREALAALELMPPIDFATIKAQYRLLVKRHHPDVHGGSLDAEEKFKTINQAFTTLRAMYKANEEESNNL